jgi:hypothetical protein
VVSAPSLASPATNDTATGIVTFAWQPTGPLPPGAAYEVVWWNAGENPAAARGFAPPTTESVQQADLDVLYDGGQFTSNTLGWTVLVVNTAPYQRLTAPEAIASRVLNYQPGGGDGGDSAPPPPRP